VVEGARLRIQRGAQLAQFPIPNLLAKELRTGQF